LLVFYIASFLLAALAIRIPYLTAEALIRILVSETIFSALNIMPS
jgi:hypothetical protein